MSVIEIMWYREAVASRETIDEKDLPEAEKEAARRVPKEKGTAPK